MAVVLDNKEIVPYPDFDNKKYLEISNIVPIVHLEAQLPEKVMQEFTGFTKSRFKEGVIVKHAEPFSSRMKFEISIKENWMMGGLRKDLRNWNQRKIGTIYWKDGNSDEIYWLLVPGEGKADVVVTPDFFTIFAKWFQKEIRFFVQGADLKEDMFTRTPMGSTWAYYFLFILINLNISIQKIQNIEEFRDRWAVGDAELGSIFEVTCKFKWQLIRQQAITFEPVS